MMASNLSGIKNAVKQLLRDNFTSSEDFDNDQLDIQISQRLSEISAEIPNIVTEVLTTIANSRVLDISAIEGLINIKRLEYPVGQDPRKYRNIKKIDQETIEIDTTVTPAAGGSGTLTGTVTFTAGSAAVTGVATLFDTELSADYLIKVSDGNRWYRIESVESATALTLAEPVRSGDDGADTVSLTEYCYEAVYLYCEKVHEVTESTSTLNPLLEGILIDGVAGYTALDWVNEIRTHINEAITGIANVNTAVDNMSGGITQAIADIVSGRVFIGVKSTEAIASIDSMTAEIGKAITDLTSGRALIGDKRDEAIAALGLVSGQIDQSLVDLLAGRGQIDDERDSAGTLIEGISDRVSQAIADIQSSRSYINKINIGGSPQNDLGNSASRELQTASESLQQANSYLNLGSTSGKHGDYAARDLQVARAYIDEARSYIALDQETTEHANFASRELQTALGLLSQARGYMELDRPATEYGNAAARELANANAYLSQGGGYLQEMGARFNIAKAISGYQNWANTRIALYDKALRAATPIKQSMKYSKN